MSAASLRRISLALAGAGLLLAAGEAPAATPVHWPKGVSIGGTNLGAAAYAYQVAWAGVLKEKLGLGAQVEATAGPVANIQLIQSRQIDFGSTSMGPAYEGFHGRGWAKGKRHDQIRILFPMYPSFWQWWVLAKSNIRHIRDVQGQDIALSGAGSTPDYYGRKMLDFFGVKPRRIISGGFGDSNNLMRDGILPASAAFAGIPHPAAVELLTTLDIRILGLPKADAERFIADFPELAVGEIPAGTYKGQEKPIETITVWFAMLTHKDVPEDLAYAVVKATFEGRPELIRGLKSAQDTLPENAGSVAAVPFHAGAIRFYRERGIPVPASALPPESRP